MSEQIDFLTLQDLANDADFQEMIDTTLSERQEWASQHYGFDFAKSQPLPTKHAKYEWCQVVNLVEY